MTATNLFISVCNFIAVDNNNNKNHTSCAAVVMWNCRFRWFIFFASEFSELSLWTWAPKGNASVTFAESLISSFILFLLKKTAKVLSENVQTKAIHDLYENQSAAYCTWLLCFSIAESYLIVHVPVLSSFRGFCKVVWSGKWEKLFTVILFIFVYRGKSLTFGIYATFLCIALMANCMSCKYI